MKEVLNNYFKGFRNFHQDLEQTFLSMNALSYEPDHNGRKTMGDLEYCISCTKNYTIRNLFSNVLARKVWFV